MAARESLRVFLARAKTSLRTAIEKKSNIAFVIGNESADLDSITSSIIYAYLKSSQPSARLHIPLLNIPKADISLRPELLALLPYANISRDHLLTLDDLPPSSILETILPPSNTRWILVDHNALQGHLGSLYSSRVAGCIDHHVDEGKVSSDADPRIITTSGSCTSLVVNYFRSSWPLSSSSPSSSSTPHDTTTPRNQSDVNSAPEDETQHGAHLAHLALASILIDTNNLTDPHKTNPHDHSAVSFLESLIMSSTPFFSRDDFFDTISGAKTDTDAISLEGLLRKDYKAWRERNAVLGISSVVRGLGYLVTKAGVEKREGREGGEGEEGMEAFLETARSFAERRELSVFAVMTAFSDETDGAFSRELLVVAKSEEGKAAAEHFIGACAEELQLEEVKVDKDSGVWMWRQGEVKASRKQVAPMLRDAMRSETD